MFPLFGAFLCDFIRFFAKKNFLKDLGGTQF
jgi:hypothetical protein